MRIIWHGHSCFEIKGSSTIVTDPHDGKSIGIKQPLLKADIVLISHEHFDHNCARIVKGDPVVVRDVHQRVEKGVRIGGIGAFHDEERGERRGRMNVFVFEFEGMRFCHCGDLGHRLSDDQVRSLGSLDFLMVPTGGVFTIDGAGARELVQRASPRVAIPMHYKVGGLSISIDPVDTFLKGIPEDKVVRVGNEVELTKEEVPEEPEYWVFSQ
jgi:L-ascorbate metabolism protein UlaG (beta-lactamase superfamily)